MLQTITTWGEGGDLGLQSVGNTLVHGGTTGHDDVFAEILSDINVGGLDGGMAKSVDTLAGHTVELWLEEELWALHSVGTVYGEDSLIWEGVLHVLFG